MAFSEFELKKHEKEVRTFVDGRRPPPNIRAEVDLDFRINGQSVEIFEIRPFWSNSSEKIEVPIAKATYVKTKKIWKVYWQRADLEWHRYDPDPEVNTLKKFLELVDRDEYACFFG